MPQSGLAEVSNATVSPTPTRASKGASADDRQAFAKEYDTARTDKAEQKAGGKDGAATTASTGTQTGAKAETSPDPAEKVTAPARDAATSSADAKAALTADAKVETKAGATEQASLRSDAATADRATRTSAKSVTSADSDAPAPNTAAATTTALAQKSNAAKQAPAPVDTRAQAADGPQTSADSQLTAELTLKTAAPASTNTEGSTVAAAPVPSAPEATAQTAPPPSRNAAIAIDAEAKGATRTGQTVAADTSPLAAQSAADGKATRAGHSAASFTDARLEATTAKPAGQATNGVTTSVSALTPGGQTSVSGATAGGQPLTFLGGIEAAGKPVSVSSEAAATTNLLTQPATQAATHITDLSGTGSTLGASRQLASAASEQVVAAIRGAGQDRQVSLRLDPPDLGRVSIDLNFEGGKLVSATLSAEQDGTNSLLRKHLDLLNRELNDAGFEGVDLSFASADEHASGDGRSQLASLSLYHDLPTADGESVTVTRNILTTERIDARF